MSRDEMSRDETSICVLRKILVDGFLIAGLTACMFAIKLLWTPFSRGFFCGDESLMFPYRDDTVTIFMMRLIGLGLPLLVMLICEWSLLRKEPSNTRVLGVTIPTWVCGLYCAAVSFGLGVCFTDLTARIAKKTIGRPRPHFFDLCQPLVDCSLDEWRGRYIQAQDYHCKGDREGISEVSMSFLSGHAAWSAFTMVYLALYLEARMTWRGTRVLRHTLQFIALMLSWFTALSRVSDYKHHWSDVLAGYTLGLVFAVLVWTWGTDLVPTKKKHSAVPLHDVYVIAPTDQTA